MFLTAPQLDTPLILDIPARYSSVKTQIRSALPDWENHVDGLGDLLAGGGVRFAHQFAHKRKPSHQGIVGQSTRPGVVVRMLNSVPPPVMYSVFRSAPPNAQLVTSSRGTLRNVSSLPSGVKT